MKLAGLAVALSLLAFAAWLLRDTLLGVGVPLLFLDVFSYHGG